MSPSEHERGPSPDTLLIQPMDDNFHALYHIQNVQSYANLRNASVRNASAEWCAANLLMKSSKKR